MQQSRMSTKIGQPLGLVPLTLLREMYPNVELEDLRVSLDFIFAMQAASLDDPHLNAALQPQ